MLWSALLYPSLPVERQGEAESGLARVVVERCGARRVVLACDDAACAAGVGPGLPLRNAFALAPTLVVTDFDPDEQRAHLEQLALQALGYSSRVVLRPPDMLLVEVQGSLRLFGGLDALLDRMRADAAGQGLTLRLGTAPTPAAAALLVRAGRESPVRSSRALATALADIPLDHLAAEIDAHASSGRATLGPGTRAGTRPGTRTGDRAAGRIRGRASLGASGAGGAAATLLAGLPRSGVRTVGALAALPPAAVTRRFGAAVTDCLYRLDGRLPDLRPAFEAPATFAVAADLPLEAESAGALVFPLGRLLGALGGFLRNRDLGIRVLELRLYHQRRAPTTVTLRLREATANIAHVRQVASGQLDGTALPAPVTRLALEAVELAAVERTAPTLLDGGDGARVSMESVLDRLVARLGERAVYTALDRDDHRPEKAWSTARSDVAAVANGTPARGLRAVPGEREAPDRSTVTDGAWPPRPLWLLRTPRLATEPLVIGSDAECIENGWWDEVDVRRDYFIAHDARGAHYWVFRLRHDPERLWIHGLFA